MNMNKTEVIARRILGWKLNRWDRWYDYEKGVFIHDSEFQPEHRLDLPARGLTHPVDDSGGAADASTVPDPPRPRRDRLPHLHAALGSFHG